MNTNVQRSSPGDQAGVDAAEVLVGVALGQLGDAHPVGSGEGLDDELAVGDQPIQRGFGGGPHSDRNRRLLTSRAREIIGPETARRRKLLCNSGWVEHRDQEDCRGDLVVAISAGHPPAIDQLRELHGRRFENERAHGGLGYRGRRPPWTAVTGVRAARPRRAGAPLRNPVGAGACVMSFTTVQEPIG